MGISSGSPFFRLTGIRLASPWASTCTQSKVDWCAADVAVAMRVHRDSGSQRNYARPLMTNRDIIDDQAATPLVDERTYDTHLFLAAVRVLRFIAFYHYLPLDVTHTTRTCFSPLCASWGLSLSITTSHLTSMASLSIRSSRFTSRSMSGISEFLSETRPKSCD